MAIDFIILCLLILSFIINLLALAAFWITPSLRSTGNRFTINLLVINLVGCSILAPTLFLNDNDGSSEAGVGFTVKPSNSHTSSQQRDNIRALPEELENSTASQFSRDDVADTTHTIESIYKCNSSYCHEFTIDENRETLVITEIEQQQYPKAPMTAAKHHYQTEKVPRFIVQYSSIRSWTIDLAAALGALGVLLVVGDTWCAVTDPLRYHSRISAFKCWLMIALTWLLGLIFGILSALREIDFENGQRAGSAFSKQKRYVLDTNDSYNYNSFNNIFSMIFSCVYFLLIILLPFGFVCGMYWRIFSEARSNGLRMRQNGSSPLLQSALNLTQGPSMNPQPFTNNTFYGRRTSVASAASSHCGGLYMELDLQKKPSALCPHRRDSAAKVLLPSIHDDVDERDCERIVALAKPLEVQLQKQHIILTIQAASGEIKRNYSSRQIEVLTSSALDLCEDPYANSLRQVHSSPNLRRANTLPLEHKHCSVTPYLLGGHLPHNLPAVHTNKHIFTPKIYHQQHHHHHEQHQKTQAHANSIVKPAHHQSLLQVPHLQASSPKTPSYMSNIRHRLSNASSLFKYREESRAARISILVVIMFLVSYLPYGILVLLQSRMQSANFPQSTELAIFMLSLANLSSPFIFAYRNKRVRNGVRRLLGLEALCLEKQLHSSSYHSQGSQYKSNLKRSIRRVSTYSNTSAPYLTAQNSVISGNHPKYSTSLRQNSSCSTIINFSLNKNSISLEEQPSTEEEEPEKQLPTPPAEAIPTPARRSSHTTRPVLQRGITIIDHVQLHPTITPTSHRAHAKQTKLLRLLDDRNIRNCICFANDPNQNILVAQRPIDVSESPANV